MNLQTYTRGSSTRQKSRLRQTATHQSNIQGLLLCYCIIVFPVDVDISLPNDGVPCNRIWVGYLANLSLGQEANHVGAS
jgi:hypothetical protein